MVSQRGRLSRSPEMSQDGGDDSMSSNLTPLQTNARGRPPLPMRQTKPNRLPPTSSDSRAVPPPPSLPTLSRQHSSSQHHVVSTANLLDTSTESAETSVNTSTSPSRSVASVVHNRRTSVRDGGEHWRSQGKIFRAKLLMKDEEMGGNFFVLSNDCDIERYYEVADKVRPTPLHPVYSEYYKSMLCDIALFAKTLARTSNRSTVIAQQVLDQFLSTSIDERTELTESYLIGNRLIKFLSTVLPTHKDYLNPNLSALRSQSQGQLVQLLQYMEQLALIIDEEELNRYILSDLTRGEGEDSPRSLSKKTTPPPPQRNHDSKFTSTRRRTSTGQNDEDDDEPEPDVSLSTMNTSVDSVYRSDSKSIVGTSTVWTMAAASAAAAQHRSPYQSPRSKNAATAATLDLEPQNDASFDESRDLSRDLSGEFDILIGTERDNSTPSEWEAQFSDLGIHRRSSSLVARASPVDQRVDVEAGNKDDFGFSREQSQKEPRFSVQQLKQADEAGSSAKQGKQLRSTPQLGKQIGSTPQQGKQIGPKSRQEKDCASTSPNGSLSGSTSSQNRQDRSIASQQKRVGSIPLQPKKSTATMEWSTNFHNRDPFQFVLKQKVESAQTSIPADATGVDETWKPDFPTFATPIKKQKKKVSFSSADVSVSNSQTTPPEANIPSRRKSSPTSVHEFHDWHSCYDTFDGVDEMKHVIQVDRPSDDCSSLGSQDEREYKARGLRRRPKNPFKGCIKCFLD
jgi:hypothetical protein